MNYYSPLRYPGGKGKIANFIKLVFIKNDLFDGVYVEPYAGGASVALSLLFDEYASKIIINDLDRSIYSFWYSVLNHTEDLCKKIQDTEVSVPEWKKQKEIQKQKKTASLIDLGFSTFFLNRTNRSGIIQGGIIGGKNQTGKWKIDARFNKKDLIQRIQRISRFRNRIQLFNKDASDLITSLSPILPQKSLIYFDPPYYLKGRDLYKNHYKHGDHATIAKQISEIEAHRWIVSYDNVEEIRALYSDFTSLTYSIQYSAADHTEGSEIIVFSPKLAIPEIPGSPTKINRKLLSKLEFA